MMEKYITDERTGLKYELIGDYYLIAGTMSQSKNKSQSEYGDIGTSAISRSITVCDMLTC